MPFLPNRRFVGREDELKSLYEKLEASASVLLGQTAAATGPGGIGKTQLVVEFAYRYGRRFAGGVFWLDMSDPDNIPDQIARCAGSNRMNLPGSDMLSQKDLVEAVMREWSRSRPRLIVFDNVEQLEIVDKWHPKPGGARVLIITRIDSHHYWWAERGIETVSVGTLPREKSLELLCRGRRGALDDPGEREAADDICDLLGDLPLALHLAGAYLSMYKHELNLKKYLDELNSQPVLTNPALLDSISDPSPTKHLQNVAATFETSYRRFDQRRKVDALAARLFHLTSHFAPASIPRELLLRALKMSKDRLSDRRELADAVNRLWELGLVQGGTEGSVIVHRLLREFARHHPACGQEPNEAAEDVAEAVRNFAEEINESRLPAKLRGTIEHLRYAATEADHRGSKHAGPLRNELGYHLSMVADFNGAKENMERALEINEEVYGPDHPDVATCLCNLGGVLEELGDLEGAKGYFKRSLEIDKKEYGLYHRSVARDLNNLGSVDLALRDLGAAKELYERVLEIDGNVYGPEDPILAMHLNNYGSVLMDLDDLKGAQECYERALEINKKAYGPDHPNVAVDLNNLGSVLQALGDLEGAKEYYELALEIGEGAYRPDHPVVAKYVYNLGCIHQMLGNLEDAEEHLRRAVDVFQKYLREEHSMTQRARRHLRDVLNSRAS